MVAYLLAIIIAFYPYAISLPASDLARGASYEATISAPAGAAVAVQVPEWMSVGAVEYIGGDTWRVRLTVTADAPDAYGRVVLLVGGVAVASQGVRVGTLRAYTVWLPWIEKAPAG